MGKVVTYAIGFANRSPLGEEIKQTIKEYQKFVSLENKEEAAKAAVQIAELLYDQCEALDPTLPEKDFKRDEHNSLKKSLRYSEKALKEFKESRNKEQEARTLMSMSRCYLKLNDFRSAILKNKEALQLLKDYNETDKYTLQSSFKLLGDIYFSKGLTTDAARYDDFSNAYLFYEKEHRVLNTMTAKDVDDDPSLLLTLKQSSHFNMGVIESKLPEYKHLGLKSLAISLKEAQELQNYESQKQALWEAGRVYARRADYGMLKRCQKMEYDIALENNSKDDEMSCLIERIKTHLELEEYSDCYELCKKMNDSIDSEDETICEEVDKMVTTIEDLKNALYKALALNKTPPLVYRISRLYLELGQTQFDYGLYRAAMRSVTYGLEKLDNEEKTETLCVIYTALFELKATIQWELKESELNDYVRLNNDLLDYINTNIKKAKAKLDYSIQVYERCAAIYRYFKQKDVAKSWDHILSIAKTEFENLEDNNDKHDDPMDIDLPDIPKEHSGLESLRMSNQLLESKITNIRMRVLLSEPVTILIPIHSSGVTGTSLMTEASRRTWQLHGIEPRISHLSVGGVEVLPYDILDNVIKSPDDIVEAYVKGIVERSPLDCYENACLRLNIATSPFIISRLNKQRMGALNLSGLELTNDQLLPIHELLLLTPYMTRLDLSSNLLYDNDLMLLLKDIKSPRELILSNNRLSVEIIATLSQMKNQTLKTLHLSYNPLGSEILLELPSLFQTFEKLENLEIEGTELGNRLELNNALQYDNIGTQINQTGFDNRARRKICINISNNHFQGNMLSEWTSKWEILPGVESIRLSGVTSDEGWAGFHQLTNFKWLKKLDFSRTVKGVLSIPDLADLLMLDSNLHHLDLSYCNLEENDIYLLCEGLEYSVVLESLNLKSNPKLGDRVIQKLESTALPKLNSLNISDCGLTNSSIDTIIQWVRNNKFNDIDVSENELLIQNRNQMEYFIQHYPHESMFIFKISLDEDVSLNDLMMPTGLKIQKTSTTQDNPFL